MNIKINVCFLISLLAITSCTYQVRNSNQYMSVTSFDKEHFPSKGKALLIVERTQEPNLAAYNMAIWDVTKRLDPALIGYLAPSMKAAYELSPGKHTLLLQMAATNNAMEVFVVADKTYYTKVATDGYGILFKPIKKGQQNDMSRNNISVATEHLIAWGKDRDRIENSLQVRIEKGIQKWNKMSAEETIKYNIIAEDGR